MSCKTVFIGNAEAFAMSVSFSGELAWEIHIPNEQLKLAFSTLWDLGQPMGLKPFGSHATESMRLEKGYRHWKADLITEFNIVESELHRFVDMKKDFFGKSVLEKAIENLRRKFVALSLDTTDYPAHPGDSVVSDGKVIGTVTSAGWGYRVQKNIAFAFVDTDHAGTAELVSVQTAIGSVSATWDEFGLYDPNNSLVRGLSVNSNS